MGKREKLIKKLKSKPKDFAWSELLSLLNYLDYEELQGGKTSGSRVKFFNKKIGSMIHLHKPHPSNQLKIYQVNQVIDQLKQEELL